MNEKYASLYSRGDASSIFQGYLLYNHLLKVVQNKSSQFHKLCRNVRDPWGTVS